MPSTNDSNGDRKKYHYRLNCPSGENGVAFLSLWLPNGKHVALELKPHEAKIILVLRHAYLKDAGVWEAGARGWRSRKEIAQDIAERTGYVVGEAAISAYAVKLLRKLSNAIESVSSGERVPLVERRRKLGFRLAENVEIEIIDGTRHGHGECA